MIRCEKTKSCYYCDHIGYVNGGYHCDKDMSLDIKILKPPYHDKFTHPDCPLRRSENNIKYEAN